MNSFEQLSFDFFTESTFDPEAVITELSTAGIPDHILQKRFDALRTKGTNYIFRQLNCAVFCLKRLQASNPTLTEDQKRYISQAEMFINNTYKE